jgi:hypothetical protein
MGGIQPTFLIGLPGAWSAPTDATTEQTIAVSVNGREEDSAKINRPVTGKYGNKFHGLLR